MTANKEKTTTYNKDSIYTFIIKHEIKEFFGIKFQLPDNIISSAIEGKLQSCKSLFQKSSLTTLDLSNFDTSNVTDMSNMFNGCSGLTTLDLSNFDTSKVTSMRGMFTNCFKLTTIGPVDTAPGWQHKPDNYTNMFTNCHAKPKPSWYK